jgi:ribosomal-protein-alanine N-acetyltransferase
MDNFARENSVHIRLATTDDIMQIFTIFLLNFESPWSPKAINESVQKGSVYVAVKNSDENAILGYIIIYEGFDTVEIMNIAVDDDCKRQGIGEKLLTYIINKYRESSLDIWLDVRDNNEAAIKLYEKKGFEQIGLRKGYYADETPPRDALTMKLVRTYS